MKINTNRLEPRTVRPNWVGHVEGKDIDGQATTRCVETRIPWIPLWKSKKGIRKKGTHTRKKWKAMKLTSHTAAMDLVVEFPGNGVVPRERFRPISQLFMGTTTEQRTEQLMAHGQVVENLEHVDQDRNRNGEQHNGLQWAYHLE